MPGGTTKTREPPRSPHGKANVRQKMLAFIGPFPSLWPGRNSVHFTRQSKIDGPLVVPGRNKPSLYAVNGRPMYVHVNGFTIVVWKEWIKAKRRSRMCSTEVKVPRFNTRRTTRLNQSAIGFSPLGCFGVYKHRRRWLA